MIMFNDPSFSDLYIPLHMVNYFLWNAMGFKLLFPLDFIFHTFICVFLVDLYVFVFAMFSRKIVFRYQWSFRLSVAFNLIMMPNYTNHIQLVISIISCYHLKFSNIGSP